MAIERRMSRDAFISTEIVELKQICLTPNQVYQPGRYLASELPDIAFTMGLVARTPASTSPDQPPAG
ncbi:MAG: hypothetical protein HC934_01170 [Acaryochloridaceae cyanobacterium SU_2_1]|nr:hypothetical protein [Acaryochloridaceae cyanobacterium SU_2_1]